MDPARGFARLGEAPLDPAEVVAFVSVPGAGAVATFSGTVRDVHEGRAVRGIDYAAAEPLATRKLEAIVAEVLGIEGVLRAAAVHRTGRVPVGEASVVVAASAAHRDAAFVGARALIDRIKEVLPVWKREEFADGEVAWAPGFTVAEADRC